jgi:hypothetical protein
MITVLRRPPFDLFTFRLFFQLSSKIKNSVDRIYTWSPLYENTYSGHTADDGHWKWESEMDSRLRLIKLIQHDVIIIGVKDHLTTGDYNPWKSNTPSLVKYFNDMFNTYRDKKFIFFTSLENLDHYISEPNAIIIPWGGDITNQKFEYTKLEPAIDKNFDSEYNYVSLNRNQRSHRAFLISLLHADGLNQHGLISCMFKNNVKDILEYLQWPLDAHMQDTVLRGFNLAKKSTTLLGDSREIYTTGNNDNIGNFNKKLRTYYRETFVEIVTETNCTEKCFNLTEKTLNSIYGCNFPILISSPGAVKFLRDMGLDMFDDIIDHSYDLVDNPIDRIQQAVYNNRRILTDNHYVKKIWLENQQRFLSNVNFVKHNMYKYYQERAVTKFKNYVNDNNL